MRGIPPVLKPDYAKKRRFMTARVPEADPAFSQKTTRFPGQPVI